MEADGAAVLLLRRLNSILDSDPLIDEVGFVHPTQLASLVGSQGGSLAGDVDCKLYCRDHKLGISTDVVVTLYREAKRAFFEAKKKYEAEEGTDSEEMEDDLIRFSRAVVLLSSDFGTAWNSRKMIVSKKGLLTMFMNELQLSELILSYVPKSDQAWSHRRWAIKMISGKSQTLQEILRKESELVEKIAERSKMNYRAWNHRGWLVSFMTREQVLTELNKSKSWAGLHVADNSSFHYRRRLLMRYLKNSCHENEKLPQGPSKEECHLWKEELNWNESLLKKYIGREALWLHRRFLSLCWIRHFSACHSPLPCFSENVTGGPDHFLDQELNLVTSCLVVPDNNFDDFEAQATHSATYTLWLAKQLPRTGGVEFAEKLRENNICSLVHKFCPNISFLEMIADANQSGTQGGN
ncbi:hypothetical protein MLD38_038702 [Melastoma candidum]|uniref:Uncharacterized protein n=1 Tax=Melastoma candidum TaxID=119954 RepID=A0ACB9L177_9MYRT|nr:hypothetical protein MLD38_038702 [Melastoma candidum]